MVSGLQFFLYMMVMIAGAFMMSSGSIVFLRSLQATTAFGAWARYAVATVCDDGSGAKVFRFTTHKGNRCEVPARPGTLHYPIGASMRIKYHAQAPHMAQIHHDGIIGLWLAPLATLLLGMVFASFGFTQLIALAPR